MDSGFDPYRELGLSSEAAATDPELVRAAFKALAKKYHPDGQNDGAAKARAEEKMRRLNEAQRLILSGEYRPPSAELPVAVLRSTPPPQSQTPPRQAPAPPPPPRRIPQLPMLLAGLGLIGCLALPVLLKRDHLKQALELEKKGQFTQAIEEANLLVEEDPRDGNGYLLRARLWQKLGKSDRAAIDLANAHGLASPEAYETAKAQLFPSPTATPTPKTSGRPASAWPKGGG